MRRIPGTGLTFFAPPVMLTNATHAMQPANDTQLLTVIGDYTGHLE